MLIHGYRSLVSARVAPPGLALAGPSFAGTGGMGLQESGLYQAKKWGDLCGIIKLCQVKKACGIISKLKEGYASVSMGIAL